MNSASFQRGRFVAALLLSATFVIAKHATAGPVEDCQSQDPSVAVQGCSQLLPLVSANEQVAIVRLLRGTASLRLKDYDSAIADLSEAIRLKPDEPQAYVFRGAAFQERGRLGEAASDIDKSIRLKPELESQLSASLAAIRFQLGRDALDKKQYPEAIAAFSEVIKEKPDLAEAYAGRAQAYQASAQTDKAVADADEAIRLKPELAAQMGVNVMDLHIQHARALEDRGDLKASLDLHNRNIETEPGDWRGYYQRAMFFKRAKQFEREETDLRKANALLDKAASVDTATQADREAVRSAIDNLPQELEMDERWTRYLKRIQAQGQYENWAGPPYDLYKKDHQMGAGAGIPVPPTGAVPGGRSEASSRQFASGLSSSNASKSYPPGQVLRDCDQCPEVVVIPAGHFRMGSPASEPDRYSDEGPQHEVKIPRAFALGRYEVMFAQWDVCVAAGGCTQRPDDEGWGRGKQPVIHVSWDDAQQYVRWLSRKTGAQYRLPSEAEWEYAARAGTTTPFSFGNQITTDQANYKGDWPYNGGAKGKYRQRTMAVASFPPNGFGLYDIYGNVYEWVEDCYNYNNRGYAGGPSDGTAWRPGDCSNHVIRGGCWNCSASSQRSANRGAYLGNNSSYSIGFRVARTLP